MGLSILSVIMSTMICLIHVSGTGCSGPTSLVPRANYHCGTCSGHQLLYDCTVIGSGTTIWEGTAFQCVGGILLSHDQFSSGTSDTCNNGAIVGRSLSVIGGNCYTSQLNVTVDTSMNGQTVRCVYNNGITETVIGTSTINIIADPFPPPNDVCVTDINLDTGLLSFNWTAVSVNCPAIHYQITTIDCGICPPTTTSNSITCHSVVVGRVCSIVISTVACGTMVGNPSNSVSVTLKTSNPSNVHSVPLYFKATESLKRIVTAFEQADSFDISNGIDGSATSYTITYSDSTSGDHCSLVTIPASSCIGGMCNHTFEVATSSCPACVDINITVYATNILGNGTISDPLTIGSTNQFINIEFDLVSSSVHCVFKQQTSSTEKLCNIVYGPGEQCTNLSQSSSSRSNGLNSVVIDYRALSLPSVYCFVLTAYDGTFSASIEGTFATGCDPHQLSDGTSLPAGVSCGAPLHSLGIRNGIVCHNGIDPGAVAFYSCFNCDSQVIYNPSSRVCLPNGSWGGSIPQCECGPLVSLSRNNTCADTGLMLALVVTTASMGLIILIMLTVFIIVIVTMNKVKAKLHAELRQVKANVLYDEIGMPPSIDSSIAKNIAYDCVTK